MLHSETHTNSPQTTFHNAKHSATQLYVKLNQFLTSNSAMPLQMKGGGGERERESHGIVFMH